MQSLLFREMTEEFKAGMDDVGYWLHGRPNQVWLPSSFFHLRYLLSKIKPINFLCFDPSWRWFGFPVGVKSSAPQPKNQMGPVLAQLLTRDEASTPDKANRGQGLHGRGHPGQWCWPLQPRWPMLGSRLQHRELGMMRPVAHCGSLVQRRRSWCPYRTPKSHPLPQRLPIIIGRRTTRRLVKLVRLPIRLPI